MDSFITIAVAAFIAFLAYLAFAKVGLIRRKKTFRVTRPESYAYHVLRAEIYVKISSQVLHGATFRTNRSLMFLAQANFPVHIIFGPHLHFDSYRFLKVFKRNKNIKLFQIRKETYADQLDREEIDEYLLTRPLFTIVDGIHCYVEYLHAEGEEVGGIEHLFDPSTCDSYERTFQRLLEYCKEVDKSRIVDSVGEENIFLVREDLAYGRANSSQIREFREFLKEEEGN